MPRLTLVYPGIGRKPGAGYIRSWQMQPLSIAVLAGLTPPEWEVTFFDDRLESIHFDRPADLVGISIETFTAKRGYKIAAEYRRRGVPVVLGGYHATLQTEEALQFGDAVCVGEAESVWPLILEDARSGRMERIYRGEASARLGGILADRRIFRGKRYFSLALVETGRGCPFSCEFCSVSAFHSATYRRRPTGEVIGELERLHEKRVFFVDDNMIGDRETSLDLFRALRRLGIRWVSQASLDACRDFELMTLMAQSGCAGLLIGFESLESRNLCEMGKGINRPADYLGVLDGLRRLGISVYGTFIFGYSHDSPELFDRTVDFAIGQKLHLAAFNHITPFPGTPLYRRLEAEGRLLYGRWWLDEGYAFGQVPFRPSAMGAEDVEIRCHQARCRFFSPEAIFRRGWEFRANSRGFGRAATFLGINWLLHREVRRKRGIPLGLAPLSGEPRQ